MIHTQDLLWTPKAKARPRVTRYGTYTDKATLDAEHNLADQYKGPKFEGPISVALSFWNDRIGITIVEVDDYTQRKLRGDIDNYTKLVFDGLNGIAYVDDRQVVASQQIKN